MPMSRPASAKPMAVDPNWAMAINEFAAASSSSEAISGSTLSLAGSKNCWTDAESSTITYRLMMLSVACRLMGMAATSPARRMVLTTMIVLRFQRSTKTPAMRPKRSVGAAETMSMIPTLRIDPVRWKTMMPAASEVSASPMVETSCPVHR